MITSFTLQIQLWQDCNLRCIHCWRDAKKDNLYLDIDFLLSELERFFDTSDVFEKFERIYLNLSWWEIFLYPEKIKKILDFLLDYLSRNSLGWRFYCRLMTNGTLLDVGIVSRLKKYKSFLIVPISFDGLEKTHDFIRWKGTFKKSLKALNFLVDNDILSEVQMVIMKYNYKEILDYIKFFSKFKLNRIGIRKPLFEGRFKGEYHERKQYLDYVYKIINLVVIKSKRLQKLIKLWCDAAWVVKKYSNLINNVWSCGVHFKSVLWIEPNWDVRMCPRLPIKLGNIYKISLTELYNNYYEDLYNKLFKPSTYCKYCKLYTWCGWGDLCEIYSYYGNLDSHPSLLCSF